MTILYQSVNFIKLNFFLVRLRLVNVVQANLIITVYLGSIEAECIISEICYNDVISYR